MSKQLKALLDKPDKRSFSIINLVTGDIAMKSRVLKYDELLANGIILEVKDGPMVDTSTEVALWIGHGFRDESRYVEEALKTTLATSLVTLSYNVKDCGDYAIMPRSEATKIVNDFLESAARLVFVHPPNRFGGNVTHLMRWTDPGHKLTRAASLYISEPGRALDRKIEWYAKLDNVSKEVIRKSAYEVVQEYLKGFRYYFVDRAVTEASNNQRQRAYILMRDAYYEYKGYFDEQDTISMSIPKFLDEVKTFLMYNYEGKLNGS